MSLAHQKRFTSASSQVDTSSSSIPTSTPSDPHANIVRILVIVLSALAFTAILLWASLLYRRRTRHAARAKRSRAFSMGDVEGRHAPSIAARSSVDMGSVWGGSTLGHSDAGHQAKYAVHVPSMPTLFPPKLVSFAPSTKASSPTPSRNHTPPPPPVCQDDATTICGHAYSSDTPTNRSSAAPSLSLSHAGDDLSTRDSFSLSIHTVPSISSLSGTRSLIAQSKSPIRTVLTTFNPLLPDELVLSVGERVTVLSTFKDGWCVILASRQTYSGQVEVGAVPSWCFEKPLEGGKARPRPVRSDSLGVSVVNNGGSFTSSSDDEGESKRKDILSWSNF